MSPRVLTEETQQQREHELIQKARELIEQDGIHALTIDKLVTVVPYSKGTIYNHFIGKEDLLIAVANQCIEEVTELFRRAISYQGKSRERGLAVMLSYLIWARLHPMQLFIVLTAHSPSVVERADKKRVDRHLHLESILMQEILEVFDAGISANELKLPAGMDVHRAVFSMWSAGFGAIALVTSKCDCAGAIGFEIEREFFTNVQLMADGLGWTPHSTQVDYLRVLKDIAEKLFAEEMHQLQALGRPIRLM